MNDAVQAPENCLICGKPWSGMWTDKHCQALCGHCGAPHQLKHDMLPEEETAPQVVVKDWVKDAIKEYHEETGERAPVGTFVSTDYNGKPFLGDEIKAFEEWIDAHDEYPPEEMDKNTEGDT